MPRATRSKLARIAALAALVLSVATVTYAFVVYLEATTRVDRTFEMKEATLAWRSLMLDAETGQRGYVLSGRREFLEPYLAAEAEMPPRVERLRALASGESVALRFIDEAEAAARDKESFMRGVIAQVDAGRRDEALARPYGTDESKRRIDAFRAAVARLVNELDHAMQEGRHAQVRRGALAVGGAILFSVVAASLLVWGWRSRREADSLEASAAAQKALLEERERAARFRETFVGVLGHDLRNPLGAVLAAFSLSMKRHPDAEDRRTLGRGKAAAERMARMIDDILDLTRARLGGGIPITPRDTDLRELVERVIAEVRLAHPHAHIGLTAGGELLGSVDPDRIAQVVSNLLGNALTHGLAGAPGSRPGYGSGGRGANRCCESRREPLVRPRVAVRAFPARRARDLPWSSSRPRSGPVHRGSTRARPRGLDCRGFARRQDALHVAPSSRTARVERYGTEPGRT